MTFARFGAGFSMKELTMLNERLAPYAKKFNAQTLGRSSSWLLYRSEKPDVYIEPWNSFVVEVKAAEIVESFAYAAGKTLRFPRFVRIREDKDIGECLSLHGTLCKLSNRWPPL
jgi:DNA ligase-4